MITNLTNNLRVRVSSKIATTASATSLTIEESIQGIGCFYYSIHIWRRLYWRFSGTTLKNNFLIVKKAKEVIKRLPRAKGGWEGANKDVESSAVMVVMVLEDVEEEDIVMKKNGHGHDHEPASNHEDKYDHEHNDDDNHGTITITNQTTSMSMAMAMAVMGKNLAAKATHGSEDGERLINGSFQL
ncbi:hypothetical protein NL676_024414 [Syzygium grande]|nr:hypothetical protein NL676_024414 [Syzygium grande]